MASQDERRAATRGALLGAARDCFVELGYEATTTEAVLARAGVSKGALYHHFATKSDLLVAVFEEVTRALVARAQQDAARARSPRRALVAALKSWMRAAVDDPVARRIVLEIGPAVLGLQGARQVEDAITQPAIQRTIEAAVAKGEAQCRDAALVGRLLSSTVAELALLAVERGAAGGSLKAFEVYVDVVVAALLQDG